MGTTLLMVGDFDPLGTCSHRAAAFERLGLTVHRLDSRPYANAGGRIAFSLRVRLLCDPATVLFNRAVLARHRDIKPDLTWFDKPTFLHPATLRRLRRGGGLLIQHNLDNPFSPLPGEPGWRWVIRCLPLYDINVTPRPLAVAEFAAKGAPKTLVMRLAFDPLVHIPRREGLAPPDLPLTFIGAPHGDRPAFMTKLSQSGRPVAVFGDRWTRHPVPVSSSFSLAPGVYGAAYREHIWRALACLGFVTHGHRDPTAHRSFEITGCGGLLLAERTEAHQEAFEEERDCLMFNGVEEAEDKAAFLERSPSARRAIAAAGARRAWRSGYSNDERQAALLAELDPTRFGTLPDIARKGVARLDPTA